MKKDKTTVLPLPPPQSQPKKGELRFKRVSKSKTRGIKARKTSSRPLISPFFQLNTVDGGEGGVGKAKSELFLSIQLIPGKVWSIFSIAWHLEWVTGNPNNDSEVGGSSEHGPAQLQTWTRSRPPLIQSPQQPLGLKRPSGKGGKASSSSGQT